MNDETVAIGNSLSKASFKITDTVFQVCRTQDGCNIKGAKHHRHNDRCPQTLLVKRLTEFSEMCKTGLTPKIKMLKAECDKELFSSTVAHITLLISHIIQTKCLAMKEYLDSTLRDVVPVAHYAALRRIGQVYSLWEKLKRLAIENNSQATTQFGNETKVHDFGYVSVHVQAGDDGDGGDSSPLDSSSDDDDARSNGLTDEEAYKAAPNRTTLTTTLTLNLRTTNQHRMENR